MRGASGSIALAALSLAACSMGDRTMLEEAGRDASSGGIVDAPTAPIDASIAAIRGGVFVHLFEWTWSDVADECESFLGPKGFAAVQVSPPSEHAVLSGNPWWERYQTVGYALDQSRSGTRAAFVDMVQRCARAGVAIYVDAVINHMTGQPGGVGSNGTRFTKYSYPGLYGPSDFHVPACTIVAADYTDSADDVRRCELVGLADLDTGADQVRSRIAEYLASLVEIGVRGFRIDAAKHMSPSDLDAIVTKVNAAVAPIVPYYFFEVIDYGGEAIHAADYFSVGQSIAAAIDVTEFNYSGVGDYFLNRDGKRLAGLRAPSESTWGLLPSERAVVFTNNHDTQRDKAIYYADGAYAELANVFMLAWPYGHPSVMSSYSFDRATQAGRDSGPPSDAAGRTSPIYVAGVPHCAPAPPSAEPGSWICEHRARSIANMVGFRRAVGSTPVVRAWDDGANRMAFGRGDRGFVVLNRDTAPLTMTFQTDLARGRYCDVLSGDFASGACSGAIIEVDAAGVANVSVAANGAIALHAEAKL